MKIFIFLFLLVSTCYGVELEYKGKTYAVKEVELVSEFKLKKPVIDETKLLTKDEQDFVEFSLKNNGRKLIHNKLRPVKNDYQNDFDRGTVAYTPDCKNYSFHKVIIPNGTIIKETNFTQKDPHTKAIAGKNLTFIRCNLVNNELDPTWNVEGNKTQIKRVKKSETDFEGKKKVVISHQVETNGTFIEVQENEEIVDIGDDYSLLMLRLNK